MRIPLYQVDAFTDRAFGGNPAAVCPLEAWLPDATLQSIGRENNLSETAFFVRATKGEDDYHLRWFTPEVEVDLCGHATLASAHVLFERLGHRGDRVGFHTKSGSVSVTRRGDLLELDFPSDTAEPCEEGDLVAKALGGRPVEVLQGHHYHMAVYDSEAEVAALRPDEKSLLGLRRLGVIATAPGNEVDFVSRFFAPAAGVFEDPATGSAHCLSVPYWAKRLGRSRVSARQISKRVGELSCEARGERVGIGGRAVLVLEGTLTLPD